MLARMRISDAETRAIKQVAAKWFGERAVVRLFGSRADDRAKGGDIDLHIVAAPEHAADTRAEIGFSLELQERIGWQKIDLVVRPARFEPEAIDAIALEKGVRL